MTGLVVGMTGGTGSNGSHHNQSTHCCVGRKTEDSRKETPLPQTIHMKRQQRLTSHADTYQQRVTSTARASIKQKEKANNHDEINQMTQEEAIKSAGNQ